MNILSLALTALQNPNTRELYQENLNKGFKPFNPVQIDTLIHTESTNNPKATSSTGAKGLMQMTQSAWDDVNKYFGNTIKEKLGQIYSYTDAYDPKINKIYGSIYLNNRIPQLLKSAGKDITQENVLKLYKGIINLPTDKVNPTISKQISSILNASDNVSGGSTSSNNLPSTSNTNQFPTLKPESKYNEKISTLKEDIPWYKKLFLGRTVNVK